MKNRSAFPSLRGPVPLAHFILRQMIAPGDKAIDACCGNGNDTVLLAELVGPTGHVWGFDIQALAIEKTAARLAAAGITDSRVSLIKCGHETMPMHIDQPVRAVVFNLGYLPGSDHQLITRPETTLSALQYAYKLLLPGGIITVAVYTGHCGGLEEQRVIETWCAAIPAREASIWRMGQANVSADAPYLLLIQKAVQ